MLSWQLVKVDVRWTPSPCETLREEGNRFKIMCIDKPSLTMHTMQWEPHDMLSFRQLGEIHYRTHSDRCGLFTLIDAASLCSARLELYMAVDGDLVNYTYLNVFYLFISDRMLCTVYSESIHTLQILLLQPKFKIY
jgi:hypothetical protein